MDLTTAQAAEQLGVSIRRVRQYIEEGRLKAKKFGHVYLVNSKSVAAFKPAEPGNLTGRPRHHAGNPHKPEAPE